MLCNCISKWCRNDRLNSYRVLWHCALFDTTCCNIVKKKYTHLVTRNKLIASIWTLHSDTNSVCIWVSCKHKVCSLFFCKLKTKLKCIKNLRVRIATCSEVTIRILLLWNYCNISNTNVVKYTCNWN